MVFFVDVLTVAKVYSWKFGGFFVTILNDIILFNFYFIVDLQHCVSFRYSFSKVIHYAYSCSLSDSFSI